MLFEKLNFEWVLDFKLFFFDFKITDIEKLVFNINTNNDEDKRGTIFHNPKKTKESKQELMFECGMSTFGVSWDTK